MAFSFGACAWFSVCLPDSDCECVHGSVIHCFDYIIECTAPSGTHMGDKSSKTLTYTLFPGCFSLSDSHSFFPQSSRHCPGADIVIATTSESSTDTSIHMQVGNETVILKN